MLITSRQPALLIAALIYSDDYAITVVAAMPRYAAMPYAAPLLDAMRHAVAMPFSALCRHYTAVAIRFDAASAAMLSLMLLLITPLMLMLRFAMLLPLFSLFATSCHITPIRYVYDCAFRYDTPR